MAELLIENHGAVRVLTMNRPDKLNALNFALTRAMVEALKAADTDESVACVVLTGAGRGAGVQAATVAWRNLYPGGPGGIGATDAAALRLLTDGTPWKIVPRRVGPVVYRSPPP